MDWMVGMIVDMIVKIFLRMIDSMPECFYFYFSQGTDDGSDAESLSVLWFLVKIKIKHFGMLSIIPTNILTNGSLV